MTSTLTARTIAMALVATMASALTSASADPTHVAASATPDLRSLPYDDHEIPYDPALGCLPSQVTLTSLSPTAGGQTILVPLAEALPPLVPGTQALDELAAPAVDSVTRPVSRYRLDPAPENSLPGPVEVRLTLGAGRWVVFERLDAPRAVSIHNDAPNVHTWLVDSVDAGLHAVSFLAETRCQVDGTGPGEVFDVEYLQWDSRQRCASADLHGNRQASAAGGEPALASLGREVRVGHVAGDPPQVERASRYVIGLHTEPTLGPGDDYHGGRVVAVDTGLNFYAVEVRSQDLAPFATQVSSDPGVRYCDPDSGMKLHHAVNDPQAPGQYALGRINLEGGIDHAWHATFGTAAKGICVVDSGLRFTHQEFPASRVVAQGDFTGSATTSDTMGHGTHVTGIALAATNNNAGIAGTTQSGILVAKVFGNGPNSGAWASLASALRWCADNGGDVVSMSLGDQARGQFVPPQAVHDAVTYAWAAGSLLVAASGNDGCAGCVTYPAKYPEVLAVGCTDWWDLLCAFSNNGPEVDLVAPGSGIQSTCHGGDSQYCLDSGTSMSTPYVSGVAALVWSHVPGLTNAQVRNFLVCGARDLGPGGWDPLFGDGIVNAGASLARAVAGSCAPACSGQILVDGFPIDPGMTYTQADVTVAHAPATGHAVAWRFTAQDGATVLQSSPIHDGVHIAVGDTNTRSVRIEVDLGCGTSLTGYIMMHN